MDTLLNRRRPPAAASYPAPYVPHPPTLTLLNRLLTHRYTRRMGNIWPFSYR